MNLGEHPARLRALPTFVLITAAGRAADLVSERLARIGVSKATYSVLATVVEFGPLSQADLGRRLGMDRKVVSGETVELERAGLLHREPDPLDPRRNRLEVTHEGQSLLGRLDAVFDGIQDEVLAALSPTDRSELIRLLGLLSFPPYRTG